MNAKLNSTITAVLLLGVASAPGFVTFAVPDGIVIWSSTSLKIHAVEDCFPGDYLDNVRDAIALWNNNPSEFQFSLGTDEKGGSVANLREELWASNSGFWFSDNGAATTVHWSYSARWMTADVIVRADLGDLEDEIADWTASYEQEDNKVYGGIRVPLVCVLIHELGHVLGLAHETDEYNVMGDAKAHVSAADSYVRYYPGEDACNGAAHLYSLDGTKREDVSVTHWKFDNLSDAGLHTRTLILNSSSVPLDIHGDSEDDDPVYEVEPGQTIKVQFTFENSGYSSQEPLVSYYLCSNHYVRDYACTWLADRRPRLNRNDVYTFYQTLTLPDTLVRNQTYSIGVIVDSDDSIDEVHEYNNNTYIDIYVK